jgi:4-aminobutyrate aminotransferase-like enzyme
VRDVDGNEFIDLTGGFAVATAGHSNVAVAAAIAAQVAELAHGLGDVHPSAVKVALLEKLAEITPQPLQISILGSAGAEAVEAALKTAWLHTKRTDVIAFEGSYHGLTMGALAVTQRPEFREPFCTQLNPHVRFAPFPTNAAQLAPALQTLDSLLDDNVAAILVEPIQGRGGIRMPAANFLGELRARCDGVSRVLIFDEIYTGMGRTGRWFACEHWNVVPDLMTIGKGLTGSIALSACIGTTEVMSSWPASTGEAIHTSTFLGNPIACAAALAQIREIEQRSLLQRAQSIGTRIERRTSGWSDRFPELLEVGGLGALQGLRFSAASPSIAIRVCTAALQRGVIALAEGPLGEVLALTPPLVVTDEQLDHALSVLEELL